MPMPCGNYGFDDRFAAAILEGRKTSTIRPLRKVLPVAKGQMSLFSGWRTKNCRRLGMAIISRIENLQSVSDNMPRGGWAKLAQKEGFANEGEMWAFLCKKNRAQHIKLADYFLTEWESFTPEEDAYRHFLGARAAYNRFALRPRHE